jgi:hypothetical protein
MKNSRKAVALIAVLLLSLALAAPTAFAQSSLDGYIQEGPAIVDRTSGDGDNPGGTEGTTGTTSAGELPFTGLDLGLLGVAGASLLVLGVGMRRLTRGPDAA